MYYKVVNIDLSSAYIGSISNGSKLQVYYKLNDWVEPHIKGSKLMVFDSLKSAEEFMTVYGWGSRIYRCEVKNPSKKGIFIKGNYQLVNQLLKVLSLRSKKKKFTNLLDTPAFEGTIFCDAVKLVEKV